MQAFELGSGSYVQLHNPADSAVDVSRWAVEGPLGRWILPPGAVLPPNGDGFITPFVSDFRSRSQSPRGGEGRLVLGVTSEWGAPPAPPHLADSQHFHVKLLDASGVCVDERDI